MVQGPLGPAIFWICTNPTCPRSCHDTKARFLVELLATIRLREQHKADSSELEKYLSEYSQLFQSSEECAGCGNFTHPNSRPTHDRDLRDLMIVGTELLARGVLVSYFGVSCSQCGTPILLFEDKSRGQTKFTATGKLRMTCPDNFCNYERDYGTDEVIHFQISRKT
jgi:hypothetical protein